MLGRSSEGPKGYRWIGKGKEFWHTFYGSQGMHSGIGKRQEFWHIFYSSQEMHSGMGKGQEFWHTLYGSQWMHSGMGKGQELQELQAFNTRLAHLVQMH